LNTLKCYNYKYFYSHEPGPQLHLCMQNASAPQWQELLCSFYRRVGDKPLAYTLHAGKQYVLCIGGNCVLRKLVNMYKLAFQSSDRLAWKKLVVTQMKVQFVL